MIQESERPPARFVTLLCRFRHASAAAVLLGTAVYFFLMPGLLVTRDLLDPALRGGAIPACAWRWHRALSPRYARWAHARIGVGDEVDPENVPGTEWPMFGSVFFLAATESLQNAYERNPSASSIPPRQYAADAIESATSLLLDPANASWVKSKWGTAYLERQNLFYRMLLITGLTSHARLTGSSVHLPLLREQVESLAEEIDRSPSGVLDDYPGEAYPSDAVWAVAAIRHADSVLGGDHSAFVARFLARWRRPGMLGRLGLPPYQIDSRTGHALDDSRGCSNSGLLVQAASLSVEQSRIWYERYAEHFWQTRAWAAGFTEFPRSEGIDRWWDVDAGPVIFGYGFAATAFGLAAARVNGRFDHAAPLAALAVAATWQLPDGSLLLPRRLSDTTNAPYLGEAGMIYILTRTPEQGVEETPPGPYPWLAYLLACAYFAAGVAVAIPALLELLSVSSLRPAKAWREVTASAVWIGLLGAACIANHPPAVLVLLLASYAVARRIAPSPRGRLAGAI